MPITCTPYTQVYGPLSVAGATCQLWLDAADATTVTGTTTVTAWRDKSGRGYNLTPGAGTTSYASQGITIDSSYLYGAGAVDLTAFTFFIVAKNIGTTYNQPFFSARPNTTQSFDSIDGFGWYMDYGNQTRFFGNYGSSAGKWITITGLNTLVSGVYSVTGTSDGVFTQWNSGTQVGTVTHTTRTNTAQGFSVGGEWDGSVWRTYTNSGTIYEVIVYNTVLSDVQRQTVEGYLAQKWGLTSQLPAGNPGLTKTLYNGRLYQAPIPLKLSPVVYYNNPITFAPGCQLWLDAADATTVTGTTTVTAWRDKSGYARHLGVGSGTTSYSSSSIQLNNSYMYVTSAVDLTKLCVFIVIKSTSAVTNQTAFDARPNTDFDYNSVDGCALFLDPPSNIRFYGQQPNGRQIQIAADSSTTKLLSFQSSDISLDGWSNGTSQTSATFTTTRTNTAKGFSIGASWNGSSYDNIACTATIYEIIVYNTLLSDVQRQSVEGYLAKKWALTSNLPGTHLGLKSTYVTPSWVTSIPLNLTVNPSSGITATGGTITIANGYKTHTFTTVGTTTFTITGCSALGATVQVLVVGGGGSGGADTGGGGGAGGAVFVSSISLTSTSYSVVVGAGGVPSGTDPYPGSNGGNSSFASLVGIGGGSGGTYPTYYVGSNGGCGGGGVFVQSGGIALQAEGYPGGAGGPSPTTAGGGGGGMGSAGIIGSTTNGSTWIGGNGGNGRSYTIGGTAYLVSGGGGGGSYNAAAGSTPGTGGTGGGGNGSINGAVGSNATYYGGGGGGSSGGIQVPGGNGYQGIVIISYLNS